MKIATSKARQNFPLQERKVIKKVITQSLMGLLFSFVIARALTALFMPKVEDKWFYVLMAAIFITLVIASYFYQRWYFATYYYDLTPDFLVIRKGVLAPSEITIPYSRLQDVYVEQDIFDRLFDLYDVHVSTATAMSGQKAHIDGLSAQGAQGLRSEILERIAK